MNSFSLKCQNELFGLAVSVVRMRLSALKTKNRPLNAKSTTCQLACRGQIAQPQFLHLEMRIILLVTSQDRFKDSRRSSTSLNLDFRSSSHLSDQRSPEQFRSEMATFHRSLFCHLSLLFHVKTLGLLLYKILD